jgi:polysaccharide export outer membrane protein
MARRAALSLAALALIGGTSHNSSINAQQKRVEPQQERPADQVPAPAPGNASALFSSENDYRISAGDVIQIQVEDAPELSYQYQVNSSGFIEMPVLGMVETKKRTTYELAKMIANRLRAEQYLNAPNVLVSVKQYNSRTFFVQGAVHHPGVVQTEGRGAKPPSLMEVIVLAGGLTDASGSTAFILRPNKKQAPEPEAQIASLQDQTSGSDQSTQTRTGGPAPTPTADSDYEFIKVNVNALFRGQLDQRVEEGDIINIPRADVYFVAGEVRNPGSFPLKEGTTLRQAISLAQNPTFSAKPESGIIFREDPTGGSRREIKVDISAVMKGKKEDIPLLPNDVIIIPNSRTKSIGGMLLTALGLNSARLPMRY